MQNPPLNRLTRFSDRVQDYIRFRPSYPAPVVAFLKDHGLTAGKVCADIGSGTGIFSELLLKENITVFAVEPNREMREASERMLSKDAHFHSVEGTAEATTLNPHSVDFVTAAQAFHWFDVDKCRAEFCRILRPRGKVALIWNSRRTDTSEFSIAYEKILEKYATDYGQVRHTIKEQGPVEAFFQGRSVSKFSCSNEQTFDLEGLKGRLLSSSYAPKPGHPNHAPMLEALTGIFEAFKDGGKVQFLYETEVTLGEVGS